MALLLRRSTAPQVVSTNAANILHEPVVIKDFRMYRRGVHRYLAAIHNVPIVHVSVAVPAVECSSVRVTFFLTDGAERETMAGSTLSEGWEGPPLGDRVRGAGRARGGEVGGEMEGKYTSGERGSWGKVREQRESGLKSGADVIGTI